MPMYVQESHLSLLEYKRLYYELKTFFYED